MAGLYPEYPERRLPAVDPFLYSVKIKLITSCVEAIYAVNAGITKKKLNLRFFLQKTAK